MLVGMRVRKPGLGVLGACAGTCVRTTRKPQAGRMTRVSSRGRRKPTCVCFLSRSAPRPLLGRGEGRTPAGHTLQLIPISGWVTRSIGRFGRGDNHVVALGFGRGCCCCLGLLRRQPAPQHAGKTGPQVEPSHSAGGRAGLDTQGVADCELDDGSIDRSEVWFCDSILTKTSTPIAFRSLISHPSHTNTTRKTGRRACVSTGGGNTPISTSLAPAYRSIHPLHPWGTTTAAAAVRGRRWWWRSTWTRHVCEKFKSWLAGIGCPCRCCRLSLPSRQIPNSSQSHPKHRCWASLSPPSCASTTRCTARRRSRSVISSVRPDACGCVLCVGAEGRGGDGWRIMFY